MSQSYFYPPPAAASNPANGTVGATAPATATEIAGKDAGGNLQVPLITATRAVAVDGSAVTQPISAAALPLPAGAATSAKQPALGIAGTPSADVLTVQGAVSMTPLKVDGSGFTQPVSAAALPLPAGAATSALQSTGNTSLGNIDTKTPALGQALAAASVPVVLPAAQVTALTPPTTVTVIQPTGTNLHVVVDGTVTLGAGAAAIGSVTVSNFPATQAISAAALPLPAGASTETTLAAVNTKLAGTLATAEVAAATSTLSSVVSSATTVVLLASNANRKLAMFYNESTATLYLAFAGTASVTAYTVQVPAGGYYELPSGKVYSGAISGIWSAANGNARITELS